LICPRQLFALSSFGFVSLLCCINKEEKEQRENQIKNNVIVSHETFHLSLTSFLLGLLFSILSQYKKEKSSRRIFKDVKILMKIKFI